MEGDVSTISKQKHDEELQRLKKLYKPNNAFNIPVDTSLEFFKLWCVFIRPFINLTDREVDVVASFLNQRFRLSKDVKDTAVLDTLLATDDVRQKVLEECNITLANFYVVMSGLRRKQVVKGSKITPEIIPNVRADDNGVFKLMILFKDRKKD
jgi:hypothetical protein